MEQTAPQPAPAPKHGQGLALVTLILALLGLTTAPIITGVIALVEKRPGRNLALAGLAVVAARYVLALLIVAGSMGVILFAGLIAASEGKHSRLDRTSTEWRDDCDRDWDEEDSELNIDTTWAAHVPVFIDNLEIRLDDIQRRVDQLAAGRTDADAKRALDVARFHIAAARGVIPAFHEAREGDDITDLFGRGSRQLIAAEAAIEQLETE